MVNNFQSGRRDLNSGPHGPEPCALAGLSHAPFSTHKSLSQTTVHSTANLQPSELCVLRILSQLIKINKAYC